MRRILVAVLGCGVVVGVAASPAAACGGLVAPNGAVRLAQTTTLAAYHDGVEHYVTSFVYQGAQASFGSIIPLPGVPTDVRRAGRWTLQRLELETHPPAPLDAGLEAAASSAAPAHVLLHTTVDALDITVLSGGGPAVLAWVKAHGFAVSPDAPAMLDYYAARSPVFLAARFDAHAAVARGQLAGDGTPVQITIPTANPWVPLHILSLAKPGADVVQADVYLLSDRAPSLLGLDDGARLQVSEPASPSLLSDLRSDKDSAWVPGQAWLTFVRIDTPAGRLGHDLAVDAGGANRPSVTQAGYDPLSPAPRAVLAGLRPLGYRAPGQDGAPVAAVIGAAVLVSAALVAVTRGKRSVSGT
jgi:hypothetical protein